MRPTIALLAGLLPLLGCSDGTGPALPPTPVATLALGTMHACRATGTATYCWGRGAEGQLGRPVPVAVGLPAAVEGGPPFVSLAAGDGHTCGLDGSGGVWCWGLHADGQLGAGDAAMATCEGQPCSPVPLAVPGLAGITAIAGAGTTTCALDGTGRAYCWGRNDLYQLGTASAPDQCGFYACSRSPLPAAGALRFRAISVSGNDHACGLTRAGEAWCWGFGRQGQLGNDTLVDRSLPVPVSGGHSFRRIAAGGLHTCAVDGANRAWCWGIDAVGGGAPLEVHVPHRVTGDVRFGAVASARFTSCGLATDGRAWCWGPNDRGEIGTDPVGAAVRFDSPTAVNGGRRFDALAPGSFTYCALDDAGETWCWGDGESGELADPALELSTMPVRFEFPD